VVIILVSRTKSTNVYYEALIRDLRKLSREKKVKIWKALADLMERPRRKRLPVKLSKINRLTVEGDTVVIPTKVLGDGELTHRVTIAAYQFSEKALEKIKKSGCEAISIRELMKKNPTGSNVKIIT